MFNLDDLHDRAMDFAEEAFLLLGQGQRDQAQEIFAEATALEQAAAESLSASEDNEPSRSVLFRSAASLALNAKAFELAERLVAQGLSGYPPPELREELWRTYEDIQFRRHLHSQGAELGKSHGLLSIGGNAIASALAPVELILGRIENLRNLVFRTAERMLSEPYRNSGSVPAHLRRNFDLFLRAFTPGSFTVVFQVGTIELQPPLLNEREMEATLTPDQVLAEVIDCFRLLDDGQMQPLRSRFQNIDYYMNFVGIARQILPDGKDVKNVGISSPHLGNSGSTAVSLKRNRSDIRHESFRDQGDGDLALIISEETHRGVLKYASSENRRAPSMGEVKLVDGKNRPVRIMVPIGYMKDVVKPYYEERVIVQAQRTQQGLMLTDIQADMDV